VSPTTDQLRALQTRQESALSAAVAAENVPAEHFMHLLDPLTFL
jgi:hypothetical protein